MPDSLVVKFKVQSTALFVELILKMEPKGAAHRSLKEHNSFMALKQHAKYLITYNNSVFNYFYLEKERTVLCTSEKSS